MPKRFTEFFSRIRSAPVTGIVLMVVWVLVLLSTPLVRGMFGEVAVLPMVNLGVVMQVAAGMSALVRDRGWGAALRLTLPILPLAWLVEFNGSHTGIPFGQYSYTSVLQPQLGGVPLLIPFAWLMMLPPSWGVAALITGPGSSSARPGRSRLLRALVAALAFTAWDLLLDPQMVAWDLWRWARPGLYFGIPLGNYLGWLAASFLISWLLDPVDLPARPLLLVYAVIWILQSIGQFFFWDQPGPALAGFLGMGVFVLLSLRKGVRSLREASCKGPTSERL
jgi:lycopene beta-cyclase